MIALKCLISQPVAQTHWVLHLPHRIQDVRRTNYFRLVLFQSLLPDSILFDAKRRKHMEHIRIRMST